MPRLILASASPRRAELLREHGYAFDVIVPPTPEPTDLPAEMPPAKQAEYLSHFKAAAVADLLSRGPAATRPAPTEIATFAKGVQRGVSSEQANSLRGPESRFTVTSAIILAADTIAALGNRVFGKPADRADARRILSSITGTAHQVITGVTLMDPAVRRCVTHHDVTAVHMRPLSDDELEAYLDSNAWRGKAGAYGIQDKGDEFVTRIEGSFSNVVGLPMELLSQMLLEWTT
jgi:septum formation protein